MVKRFEDPEVTRACVEAKSLYRACSTSPMWGINIDNWREMLIVNGVTTEEQIKEHQIKLTMGIVDYQKANGWDVREKLFAELSPAEMYVVLVGMIPVKS